MITNDIKHGRAKISWIISRPCFDVSSGPLHIHEKGLGGRIDTNRCDFKSLKILDCQKHGGLKRHLREIRKTEILNRALKFLMAPALAGFGILPGNVYRGQRQDRLGKRRGPCRSMRIDHDNKDSIVSIHRYRSRGFLEQGLIGQLLVLRK